MFYENGWFQFTADIPLTLDFVTKKVHFVTLLWKL